MSDFKCTASIDGICRNVIGNGTKCGGYSEHCSLRKHYKILSEIENRIEQNIKNAFGIKGDLK